ncbi:hypothetical protein LF844_14245 [Metapseudomonas lalkuanensis]|uniref:hypothetical protein n=1 Tax=Metapseudomonas lalkuanensis TaxID=2604832 RepID=UPI001CF56447|nr:hypothetical protein [Pseudomonas lalkuanensis]UCO95867.1 hypothetical protein LF844_14245 [Pseudomonas lalkuanensis]
MKRLLTLLLCCLPVWVLAAEPEVRVQARLVPADKVLVGGTVGLEVDLLVDTWFTAAPILPKLDLPGTVVNPPGGEAQKLTEQHDGKPFFGLRFTYQITPQAARQFAIPALEFQVRPGQASGPVTVRSQPLAFVAKAVGTKAGEQHLVARNLTFTQDIQRSHDPLRAGDSITRRLTIRAEGAQAMLIPPPELAEVKGLKRYLQTPKVQPLGDGRGGIDGGSREDSATYVIGEAGHLILPAIELTWWDAASGEAHTVSVPAVELDAAKGSYQAPFSISEDLHALGQKARVRISGYWLLLGAVLVVAGCLVFFGRPWGRAALSALQRWRATRQKARLESAGYAWKLARQQLQMRPAQLGGLYLWVRRSTGYRTLSALSGASPERIENRLLAFLKSRYGADQAASGTTADLMQALPDMQRAVTGRKTVNRAVHGLKPLNP